jgi:hypothetical protein
MKVHGLNGYLSYQNHDLIDEEALCQDVSDYITDHDLADSPENFEIIVGFLVNNDEPPYTNRQEVLLVIDGDDALYDPVDYPEGYPLCVMFIRWSTAPDGVTPLRQIHVFSKEVREVVEEWIGRLLSDPFKFSQRYQALADYLIIISDDPTKWEILE